MKQKIIFFFVFLVLSYAIFAQTKDSTIVGPGIVHYHEFLESGPNHMNILVVDLTNPLVKLQTVKAQDKLLGFERTSSMANRNHSEGHQVVGAVNGDFYNTSNGVPISTQVVNGEILKNTSDRYNFASTIFNQPLIAMNVFSGKVFLDDTLLYSISEINTTRETNQLIYYNSYYGTSTGTNQYGTEIKFYPLDQWILNDTMLCIVESKQVGVGNMTIGKSKGILSGHGTAASALNFINVGDTIKVYMGLSNALNKLDQLIGGGPVIIQNGVNIGSTVDVHPRTSIGFNQDSTKLFLFTVDGRQPGYSVGMSLYQLADYMIKWGVYQGLNLDGGGSTTMWVRGEIVNSPSDAGGERSVSNSLLIISETFTDTLSQIRISPNPVYVTKSGTVTFSVKGFDQYYNPVAIVPGTTFWSCDTFLGNINQSGLFTAKDDTLIGYVYADVNGIRDSAHVYMTRIDNITLEPSPIILQVGQNQVVTPTARDNYNNIINLATTDYNWSCTDSIGTISTGGNFYATGIGTGFIYAEYDSVVGSVPVSVGVSEYVIIDDFSNLSGYTLTGTRVDLANCSFVIDSINYISPQTSGKLNYKLLTGGTSTLYLEKEIPISGTPDKIGIYVYGDGKGHWLRGEFKDADNERFIIDFTAATPGIDWTNSWQYLEKLISSAVPSWANPGATLTFPIKWWRIYLAETNDAKKDAGAIKFDDFKVHFIATDLPNEKEIIPKQFQLNQNYPNPFNPNTIISYSLPEKSNVKIKVFDTLGREVVSLVNEEKPAGVHQVEFKGSNLASGVYLYRIEAGNYNETKKMILLK